MKEGSRMIRKKVQERHSSKMEYGLVILKEISLGAMESGKGQMGKNTKEFGKTVIFLKIDEMTVYVNA